MSSDSTVEITTTDDSGNIVRIGPARMGDVGTALDQVRHGGETPERTGRAEGQTAVAGTVAAGQLRAFVERVERLEEEKQAIADDIKEVFAEMKAAGFDTKAVRAIIRMRKKDASVLAEEQAMLDLYMTALGMV